MADRTTNTTLKAHVTGNRRCKRAVLYLRVSTPGQVNTDYDPEGISIPAQREAGKRKADALSADIVNEFVEPGRTATSIDKRPKFQEMIAWVKAQKDVDYVIVYHFNRVFRNGVDAGITKRDLKKVGTRIVSTVLDMGENPEAVMVEAIIHAVDQYQSEANGADIKYKMGQKAKNGGTIATAPLGYLNVREPKPEGGEVRTVILDPQRSPLIRRGIELYATGQYRAQDALDRINNAGLRTRGRRGVPGAPLSLNQFYDILADRYYCGFITYDGQEYPGRHPQLITEDTYERVQRVLALHGGGDTRDRKHHHWLKGLLSCKRCGHRIIIARGKGNGGIYFYFFCRGRQQKLCDLPYIAIDKVESAVDKHFGTIRLYDDFQQTVRRQLDGILLAEQSTISALKKRLTSQLNDLDAKEDGLLDLIGDPDWPHNKIKQKLAAIERQRATIQDQLEDTVDKLEEGRQFFQLALDLLADPQGFYRRGSDNVKRAMTKVLFSKLHIDAETVAGHTATDGIAALLDVGSPSGSNDKSDPFPKEGVALDRLTEADLLAVALSDSGSSKSAMVGDTGIEPVTSSV